MNGERATSIDGPGPVAPRDRVCAEPGCATQLSIYNELEHCAAHAPMVVPRMRGRVYDD